MLCKESSVPGIPWGHNAVEHINPPCHGFHQVFGRADAHEIPRFSRWQERGGGVNHLVHKHLILTNAQASNGITVKTYLSYSLCTLFSEVIEHAALDYAEDKRGKGQGARGKQLWVVLFWVPDPCP